MEWAQLQTPFACKSINHKTLLYRTRRQAEDMFYEQSEVVANEAFENPHSLEPAAHRLGLTVQSTPLFTRDVGTGIAANGDVRAAAFGDDVLRGGNNSDPIELTADRLVVLRIKEHLPAAVRPLEDVKEKVIEDLRRQKAEIQAQAVGRQIVDGLKDGGDGTALAEEHGFEWKDAGFVTRDNRSVNRDVLAEVFRLAHPSGDSPVISGVQLSSGDYAVVSLQAVEAGDPSAMDEAQRDNLVLQQRLGVGRAELGAVVEQLEGAAKVVKYPENI